MSANSISTTTNIVGNSQVQLGSVVGVDSNSKPTGGPIYYPLLSGAASIGAGSTTAAYATDEIGTPRPSNGPIDLGAVQQVVSLAISANPASQKVTAGATVSFTASASGTPTPTVQWQVSTDGGKTFSNISEATSATLALNNVTTAMNGYEYEAVFTNSAGNIATSAATLTVNSVPPSPPSPPPPLPTSPVLHAPPLLSFFDSLLGGTVTDNANGTETITDSLFGIPLIVSTFDSHGDLVSVTMFGFNITFLFV